MRGKHAPSASENARKRITPADAGKTIHHKSVLRQCRDHPRGCGENLAWGYIEYAHSGSPPRMRGKRNYHPYRMGLDRITPADAGKTTTHGTLNEQDGDHPRGCGENGTVLHATIADTGSPPRMRGKLSSSISAQYSVRITPADAGKTGGNNLCFMAWEDHPRGCGENISEDLQVLHKPGSPPRMRGKPELQAFTAKPKGITPADAGKTICIACNG